MSSTQGTPASRPLRYPRSLVDHAHHSKYNTNLLQQNCLAGDTYRQALSALIFTTTATIAWQDFLCRQEPRALVFTKLQTPPDAPLLTARRHRDPEPPVSMLSLGGSITTVRRYTSTCTVLVLV